MADIKVSRQNRLVITVNGKTLLNEDVTDGKTLSSGALYNAVLKAYDIGAADQRQGANHGVHRVECEEDEFYTNT